MPALRGHPRDRCEHLRYDLQPAQLQLLASSTARLIDKTLALSQASLLRQEGVRIYAGLLENGAQRSLGHVAGVVRDGGVTVQRGIEPNLMRAGCLAVELQAELL